MPTGAVVSRDKGFVMRTRTWAGSDRSSRPATRGEVHVFGVFIRMILRRPHIRIHTQGEGVMRVTGWPSSQINGLEINHVERECHCGSL